MGGTLERARHWVWKLNMSLFGIKFPQDYTQRCGISWLVTYTPQEFKEACAWHDEQYDLKHKDDQPLSRVQVDAVFYQKMKQAAKDDLYLRGLADVYYKIVQLFGGIFWKG